jgi:hypothetical protein
VWDKAPFEEGQSSALTACLDADDRDSLRRGDVEASLQVNSLQQAEANGKQVGRGTERESNAHVGILIATTAAVKVVWQLDLASAAVVNI